MQSSPQKKLEIPIASHHKKSFSTSPNHPRNMLDNSLINFGFNEPKTNQSRDIHGREEPAVLSRNQYKYTNLINGENEIGMQFWKSQNYNLKQTTSLVKQKSCLEKDHNQKDHRLIEDDKEKRLLNQTSKSDKNLISIGYELNNKNLFGGCPKVNIIPLSRTGQVKGFSGIFGVSSTETGGNGPFGNLSNDQIMKKKQHYNNECDSSKHIFVYGINQELLVLCGEYTFSMAKQELRLPWISEENFLNNESNRKTDNVIEYLNSDETIIKRKEEIIENEFSCCKSCFCYMAQRPSQADCVCSRDHNKPQIPIGKPNFLEHI